MCAIGGRAFRQKRAGAPPRSHLNNLTLGVIVTEAGIKFPGYLSISQDLTFGDVPGSLDGAYFGVPLAGWAQIVALVAALDGAVFRQDPSNAPGDVVQDLPIDWGSDRGSNRRRARDLRARPPPLPPRARRPSETAPRSQCATTTRRSRPSSSTSSATTGARRCWA